MIKELINFTNSIDENFKILGLKPKEGLHVKVKKEISDASISKLVLEQYEYFSKKEKGDLSDFLKQCVLLHQNAWCINTNKCFDLPTKAIHTCSPFAVGFKREHLEEGGKYNSNQVANKKQIYERFDTYFEKAFDLFGDSNEKEKYVIFKTFFSHNEFSQLLKKIEADRDEKYRYLLEEKEALKLQLKECKEKLGKDTIKNTISEIDQQLLKVKPLDDGNYIIFYLDVPLEKYKEVHKRYLDDKLFNTDKYNTEPNEEGVIFGTNNFMNGFNGNMPFLMHQTASFDITGRISNIDAKFLNDLENILPNKTLPNPLPIFVYKEELQEDVISIFRENGFKIGYKEIMKKLIDRHHDDIYNYYLLFWQNTKDGIIFRDFDFVSKFEYKIENLVIHNLFKIKEKEGEKDKYYPLIANVFDFEQQVFIPLIRNKYLRLDYFGELNKEDFDKRDLTFISYCKYRKSVYDFVYKSQRNVIDGNVFYEMVFNAVLDDIKNNNTYGIKEKLNVWYSLHAYFNPKQNIDMINKLKEYQDFVETVITDGDVSTVTNEEFAFAAGQVVSYILSKSRSADNSYNLLEPYLQQSKCSEFQKAITNDFGRYKHENFSKNFEKVAAVVLSYETDTNLKHLLPQILSGVFAKNQLFSSNNSK